jgi:hypothetical protein
MPPELLAQLLPQLIQFGPTVVLVVLLFFGDQKNKGLQQIVAEQIEDKKTMREEKAKYEEMLREHYTISTRLLSQLERIEKKLNR